MDASEVMDRETGGWEAVLAVRMGKSYRGVFQARTEALMGLSGAKKVVSGDNWRQYELRHFLRGLIKGDDEMVAMLNQPQEAYLLISPLGETLLEKRDELAQDEDLADELLLRARYTDLDIDENLRAQLANAKNIIRTIYRQLGSSAYQFGTKAAQRSKVKQTIEESEVINDEFQEG